MKNIESLRNYVLKSLEDLANRNIDATEAGVIAKGSETIMSSLKLQLAYAAMIGETPRIDFLEDSHKSRDIKTLEVVK